MNTFERIERELEKRNMTGADLARTCGFSNGLYSQWKSGMQNPSAGKIIQIADYLGVSVDYLLGRTEQLQKKTEDEWEVILNQMSDESLLLFRDYAKFLIWRQAQAGEDTP